MMNECDYSKGCKIEKFVEHFVDFNWSMCFFCQFLGGFKFFWFSNVDGQAYSIVLY